MRLLRLPRLTWVAVGAAAAYLFDRERGAERRARLSNRLSAARSGRSPSTSSPRSTPSSPMTPMARPDPTADALATPLVEPPAVTGPSDLADDPSSSRGDAPA